MTSEERELINKLITDFSKGDKKAYDELYKRFYNYYLTFIRIKMNNDSAAEDLTQQLFVNIFSLNYEKITIDNMSGYFFSMAANLVRNYASSRARKQEVELKENIAYEQNFESLLLEDMLSGLTKQERAILELRYNECYNIDEVAKMLGVSVSTIWRRTESLKQKILKNKKKWMLFMLLLLFAAARN